MSKGNRYSYDFKKRIVDLYRSGVSITNLSKEYGVSKSAISGWIKNIDTIKNFVNESDAIRYNIDLKNEISKVKEENEILKKAMAILIGKI